MSWTLIARVLPPLAIVAYRAERELSSSSHGLVESVVLAVSPEGLDKIIGFTKRSSADAAKRTPFTIGRKIGYLLLLVLLAHILLFLLAWLLLGFTVLPAS